MELSWKKKCKPNKILQTVHMKKKNITICGIYYNILLHFWGELDIPIEQKKNVWNSMVRVRVVSQS